MLKKFQTPLHVVTKDDQYSSIPSISYKSQDQMNVTLGELKMNLIWKAHSIVNYEKKMELFIL